MITPHTYLMDGPLSALPITRERVIGQMATLLFNQRAFADRGDAIRVLRADDYSTIDIMILVDDAIYLARQHVVAMEMSEP